MRRLAALLLLSFLAACAGETATVQSAASDNLQFFDPSGKLVASGKIELSRSFVTSNGAMKGDWSLTTAGDGFPPGVGKRFSATAEDGQIYVDLNAGMADNNVLLNGRVEGDEVVGEWLHATFAGGRLKGTFKLRL